MDTYEREQQRLIRLLNEVSSGDEDEEPDPYEDVDGEYGSDTNYVPDEDDESLSSSSGDEQPHLETSSLEPENEVPPLPEPEEDWEATTIPIPDFTFDASTNRVKVDIGPNADPLDVFQLFITPNILDYIIECTNNYGATLAAGSKTKTRRSRNAVFRSVTVDEMKQFLGLCLLQGQISTSNMRRYFSHKDILYFHPLFSYIISGRRFEQILRAMCCSLQQKKGREKVQPLIDMIIAQCQAVYGPNKELSIDESLLHFRGRLGFRVYIKGKKSRYGIKFYELTTSDGYLLNMEMYSGATTNDDSENTKIDAVVLRLMKPYLLKGHELFMDNYYNSVELSSKLLSLKTHTNGTLRSNRRGNPKDLVQKKLKRGEHYWVRKKHVYVSKWKDKRDVLVITTRNHPRLVTVKNRFGKEKIKPEEVSTYNDHMSGIDRLDQMTSTYSSPRKTIRWYKKVIFHLLDICTWNAYYIYCKCNQGSKTCRFLQFRDQLIKILLKIPNGLEAKDLMTRNKHDNRRHENVANEPAPTTSRNSLCHWPEKNPGTPGAKSNKKSVFLKCKMCTIKGIRKESSYRCKGCPGKPALCPDCFEEWHDKK